MLNQNITTDNELHAIINVYFYANHQFLCAVMPGGPALSAAEITLILT